MKFFYTLYFFFLSLGLNGVSENSNDQITDLKSAYELIYGEFANGKWETHRSYSSSQVKDEVCRDIELLLRLELESDSEQSWEDISCKEGIQKTVQKQLEKAKDYILNTI